MIDERAVIDPTARIAEGVTIGPYAIIGAEVEIGPDCWIGPHAVVQGPCTMGRENRIFQFASVGEQPQDMSYRGEATRLEIGDRNLFRENCTINRGTLKDSGVTRIGSDNWFMAGTHVAHDCIIGNHTIFANGASLGGHVVVGDWVILGGFTLVHQYTRIGAHAFSGMGAHIRQDLPPYVLADGQPARAAGINLEGLRRRNFGNETIQSIKRAYKLLYRSGLRLEEALRALNDLSEQEPAIGLMVTFIEQARRGLLR